MCSRNTLKVSPGRHVGQGFQHESDGAYKVTVLGPRPRLKTYTYHRPQAFLESVSHSFSKQEPDHSE